jgi:hypothetical protein
MKRIFAILLALLLTVPGSVSIAADTTVEHNHTDLDIQFHGEAPSLRQQELIERHFSSNAELPQKRGNLLCVFGHSIQSGSGIVFDHNAYPTSPKCKKTDFSYNTCKRSGCDYYVVTRESSQRLACH